MICFCAERFHWRRIWQNPGELLIPGMADMATRALLYRRPAEPSTSSGQARLANLFGSAAPASPRAALHVANSSERPRSDPDHAAARHHRRRQGLRAASRRLDRRASWPFAEGGAVPSGHRGSVARRSRTGSCIAPASAARCGRKRATAASGFSASRARRAYRAARPRLPEARSAPRPAQGGAGLCRGARRQGQAAVDPRPVEPLGFLHLGGLAVVLVAADPGAALSCWTISPPMKWRISSR